LKSYSEAVVTECTLTVRTYDCDSYNHVNNANYLNYLEYGRYEYLKTIGFDYPAAFNAGYGLFIARIEIDYKKPALADETLTIKCWPVKKGAVSGVIAQEIRRGEDIIVQAKVTWAFVDSNGQPSKIPPEWNVPGLYPDTK
jgi:acyl-CoA thioester hydrolase